MSEDVKLPGADKIESEIPPEQGMNLVPAEGTDLKDGDKLFVVRKTPNKLSYVNQLYEATMTPEGKLLLTPIKDDLGPEEERKALAKEIATKLAPSLREEVGPMVEEALTRKPVEKLKRMKEEASKAEGGKLKTRKGCVYLEVGKENTLL